MSRHLALAARLGTLVTERVVAPARENLWGAVWVHGCWWCRSRWCWGWCGMLGQLAQGGLAMHSSGRRFVSLPELLVPESPTKAAWRCDRGAETLPRSSCESSCRGTGWAEREQNPRSFCRQQAFDATCDRRIFSPDVYPLRWLRAPDQSIRAFDACTYNEGKKN